MAKKKRPTSAKPSTCDKCGTKAESVPGRKHRRCSAQPPHEDGTSHPIREKHAPTLAGAGKWE